MMVVKLCRYISRPSWQIIHLKNFKKPRGFESLLCKHCSTSSTNQDPVKLKLDPQLFQSILSPELLIVKNLFQENSYEIRIVGGAVRDLLMGKSVDDLDLCTTATPTEMKDMYDKAGIRVLSMTGVKHGTVAIRVNDKQNFETTTLRIDIKTDGRHAFVQFTKDWRLDANRRDLTVNSLFLDFDGVVHDYFNGLEDVKNRKIRFVNDPEKRIQEDYLRILRYFRFYGRIAQHPNSHEDNILEAIKRNTQGLNNVSGQRILVEMKKIVLGRYSDSIVRTMTETGVSKYIGLPENVNLDEFTRVVELTADNQPNVMTRIAALFTSQEQLDEFHARVFLSNKEKSLCSMILQYRDQLEVLDLDTITKHYSLNVNSPRKQLQHEMSELCKYKGNTELAQTVVEHEFPECPVHMMMLSAVKRIRRKYTPIAMESLCRKWVESGYSLTREQLLEMADEFIEENKDRYDKFLYIGPRKVKKKN